MKTTIKSIATGIEQTYKMGEKIFQSAYKKDNFVNSCTVNELGIEDDFQVDKRFHGGLDKAIHIGSSKHFETFKNIHKKKLDPLAIGCNIFIDNYDENDICIGDIYSFGEIVLEVTQPRQPCWKIGAIFGKETSRYISKNNATGWYVRVLQTGVLKHSDTMKLTKRVSDITIKELSTYLNTPPKENEKLIKYILTLPTLAQSYKDDLLYSLRNG
jgi:MOSC domain-containing protein YiiM